ncbi:MAG: nucleotide exchange factor GrpE [Deltaproteobacteria bacterium]|nr:nucleotide exchange factor GrpE [Deltaproteobacteria bacterium]MBW2047744.1 nucleotide exchange factor GrpE [Deltaproteobacteria bacterium]HDZ90084.1 nucleotide exchange factor GrpE [Deltaproteobacteria bacterium]
MNEDKMKDESVNTASGEHEEVPAEEDQGKQEKAPPVERMTKAELLKKVEELQEAADKNLDLYMRSQAEIDNLKKRYQKEHQSLIKFGNESLIKQLLPVMDNLEQAIAHSENEDSIEAIREGVELTLKGLMDVLKKAGVERIEAVGTEFDPNFHEAVSEINDDTKEPGTVAKDLQKGYTLHGRLIRPSMVVVNRKTP